tara:strand:- start:4869 stop:5639 length:771 start_codon:yes stop_codon:yes gene_type:complete
MKKTSPTSSPSTWDIPEAALAEPVAATQSRSKPESEPLFDLEGLMTDFPTARDLEKFVFDQTGIVLNLKGRSNKFKYQSAMDVLNGQKPDEYLLGKENPYLDKNDIIPVDELRSSFPIPAEVRGVPLVTLFQSKQFPHPDADWKAAGQLCDVVFKKYSNNVITYEIIGPVAQRAVGTRLNKYGKEVPERFTWVDPRTGEQVIRNENGAFTPVGTRLKAAMQRRRVANTDHWAAWVDRDFVVGGDSLNTNDPWGNLS